MTFRASTGLNTVYLTLSLLGSLKVWRGGGGDEGGGGGRGGEGRVVDVGGEWKEGRGGEGRGRIWREGEGVEGRVWWQVKSLTWCDSIWQGRIFENGFCKSHHFHKRFHLILQSERGEREREKGRGEE